MNFDFISKLEQEVLGRKCVGLRRIANYNAWTNEEKIRQFVLGDVATEHMDKCIELFLENMNKNELETCLILETKGLTKLPKMIHYMDEETCHKHCHKALRELMLERVWPKLLLKSS